MQSSASGGLDNSPAIGSSAWWMNPEREDAPSDPDAATAKTIGIMCRHIAHAANDPLVRDTAMQAVEQFSGLGGENHSPGALASAAWWWCKVYIKFVHHEFLLRTKLGEAGHLQGLIPPDALLRLPTPEGDCAIFSECLCAFLKNLRIPFELVTVAVNPNEPDIFSHVYCYAVMPDGSRLPLDASHGKYPGWCVPSSDVSRRQVWDESGNPVSDRGSRFDGLHGYGLRGMGDTEMIDVSTSPANPDYGTMGSQSPEVQWMSPGTVQGPQQPASGGSNWSAFFQNLTGQGLNLVGKITAPTTTMTRNADGSYSYSAPSTAATPLFPGGSLGGGSSMIWILGGVAVLVLFMSGKKGR